MNSEIETGMWVFNGAGCNFPSGIFSEKSIADKWIGANKLSGILTLYPLNEGVYDWAIKNELFTPKSENQVSSDFIQKFTSASMEHHHYENGKLY